MAAVDCAGCKRGLFDVGAVPFNRLLYNGRGSLGRTGRSRDDAT